jgi:hypothetical protein
MPGIAVTKIPKRKYFNAVETAMLPDMWRSDAGRDWKICRKTITGRVIL